MPFDSARPPTYAAQMRALFGPNGERWSKGRYLTPAGNMCLVAAANEIGGNTIAAALVMHPLLRRAGAGPVISSFNDAPSTTFADILRVLDRMEEIEIAGSTT